MTWLELGNVNPSCHAFAAFLVPPTFITCLCILILCLCLLLSLLATHLGIRPDHSLSVHSYREYCDKTLINAFDLSPSQHQFLCRLGRSTDGFSLFHASAYGQRRREHLTNPQPIICGHGY